MFEFTSAQMIALGEKGFRFNRLLNVAFYHEENFFQVLRVVGDSDFELLGGLDGSVSGWDYFDTWQSAYKEIWCGRNAYGIGSWELAKSPLKAYSKHWRVIDKRVPGRLELAFSSPGYDESYWVQFLDGEVIQVCGKAKAKAWQELADIGALDKSKLNRVLYSPRQPREQYFVEDRRSDTKQWLDEHYLINY